MLKTLQRNLNRNIRNLQLYELSKIFSKEGEKRSLILGACGSLRSASVHQTGHDFDFFDLKGDIEQVLQPFDVIVEQLIDAQHELF